MSVPDKKPDCIEAARRNSKGYGLVRHNGKLEMAHRLAYCQHHGIELSDIVGLVVRHKCDNPPCINPDHLEIGTHADNMRDMAERGRAFKWNGLRKGAANPKVKLTPENVEEIRNCYVKRSFEYGSVALGRKYGVNNTAILDIIHGKTWKS